MKTPRFNVFNQIHKALRAFMFETALVMQQTDFTNPDEAADILAQTDLLLNLMDNHAANEDEYILGAAAKHAPDVIALFENEHATDMQLTENLRHQIAAYRAAQSAEERYELGFGILYAFNDFIAFNLSHMHKEETLLNNVLWANYSDAEIMQMEARIQQQIAPDKMLIYFKWMVKAINNTELLQWLTAVKNEAPDFVFNSLLQTCQANLTAQRWDRIALHLAEGELV